MKADILKRVHQAELRNQATTNDPFVLVIRIVEPSGEYLETYQYKCRETGHTWTRRNNETLNQFVDRVEQEGKEHAAETGRTAVMLIPADVPETKQPTTR